VESFFDLSDCRFVEKYHGSLLGCLVDRFELNLEHGATLAESVIKELLKDLVCIHHGLLALILADVRPTGFDRWNCSRIDRVDIRLGQVVKHFSIQRLVVELLGFDAVHDFAAQGVDLLDEFRPQVVQRDVSEVLELVFLSQRSYHSATIAFLEEALQ